MKIKILGTGCPRCMELERRVFNTLARLNIDADVERIKDIKEFPKYGVFSTPALVINEKLISQGKVPDTKEIEKYLKENL